VHGGLDRGHGRPQGALARCGRLAAAAAARRGASARPAAPGAGPNLFHADAGALAATLLKLDARVDELKSQVYDTVRVHKREFVAAYNRTAGLRAQVRALADDLSV
jgi:hypothetical protein